MELPKTLYQGKAEPYHLFGEDRAVLLAEFNFENHTAEVCRRYNEYDALKQQIKENAKFAFEVGRFVGKQQKRIDALLAACKKARNFIKEHYIGAKSICEKLGITQAITGAEKT